MAQGQEGGGGRVAVQTAPSVLRLSARRVRVAARAVQPHPDEAAIEVIVGAVTEESHGSLPPRGLVLLVILGWVAVVAVAAAAAVVVAVGVTLAALVELRFHGDEGGVGPVSYTHLTLPTNHRV